MRYLKWLAWGGAALGCVVLLALAMVYATLFLTTCFLVAHLLHPAASPGSGGTPAVHPLDQHCGCALIVEADSGLHNPHFPLLAAPLAVCPGGARPPGYIRGCPSGRTAGAPPEPGEAAGCSRCATRKRVVRNSVA